MRYVAKIATDRILHMSDHPFTRSYCRKLRGALVVIDADYASERIADRTVKVCGACRTVLDDRRAAERSLEDSFMITEVEGPARRRPQVEPTLFDLGETEALPVAELPVADTAGVEVVGIESVTAAGIPVADVPAEETVSAGGGQDCDYEAIAAGLALIRKANRAIETRHARADKPGADWHVKQVVDGYEGTPTYNGTHGTASLYATADGTAYEVCVFSYVGKQQHKVVRKTLNAAFKVGQKLANGDPAEHGRRAVQSAAEATAAGSTPAAEDDATGTLADKSNLSGARQISGESAAFMTVANRQTDGASVGPVVGVSGSEAWLPDAAVLVAETAMAHGWTVAMERHPSGVVVVRAAERMPRPYLPESGELVAVWVDGVYDAGRSAAYVGPIVVVVAPSLKRVLATVGRAAKAGEIITARPRLWAEVSAPAGVSDPGTEDGQEDDGGACVEVDVPRASGGDSGAALTPPAAAEGLPVVGPDAVIAAGVPTADSATPAEADEPPVAVFIASQHTTPARMRVMWWMSRHAAVRLCSDPRTSWRSSALHWTAAIDPDAEGVDWEFVADRRPAETAELFAELFITPLSLEQVRERKPGTCGDPERWCNHAWPCGRDFEEWKAKQPKSRSELRREEQAAAVPAPPAAGVEPERQDVATRADHRADRGHSEEIASHDEPASSRPISLAEFKRRAARCATFTVEHHRFPERSGPRTADSITASRIRATRPGADRQETNTEWPKASLCRIEGNRITFLHDKDGTDFFTYVFPFGAGCRRPGSVETCGRTGRQATDADPAATVAEPEPRDVATGADPVDVWEGEGGAAPGVSVPAAVPAEERHQSDDNAADRPACDATIRYAVAVPATALRGNSLEGVCTCGGVHWSKAVDEPRPGRRAEACDQIVKRWGYERTEDWRSAGERTAVRPITAEEPPAAQATQERPPVEVQALFDLGDAEPLPVVGVEAVTAAGVPMVGGCCSCGEAIEQPLNGLRPACTHEGTTYPDGSAVVGGCRVTPAGYGRCFTDRHDVDGVALYEARNTVARCGGCVAADLGVNPADLPAVPESSNMSGARQVPPAPADAGAPAPVEAAAAVMPIDWAKPAGRGDCAAANTCGGFGVPLWDVPGCAPRCVECAARIMGHSPAELRALTLAALRALILPGDVAEAEEEAEAADIVIRHTHEDGTTVEGSSKGDGVWEALQSLGWTYRRTPGIHIRGSRYKSADRWKINRAADAVRGLGLSCAVVIEETMSFAEREAARVEAAEDRAERFTDRAGRAAAESDRLWDAHNSIGERFFMGQPILIGHHSEKRARRDQERMWAMARKSVSEQRRAGYWANRAAASEAYERYRKNPARTLRRIEKLEADRRGVLRERDGVDDKGRKADVWRSEPSAERLEELTRRLAEYDEELTYWAETIKEAERRGFKVWGKADFVRGDFARCRGTWYEVTRVNAKSVTIPHIHAEFDGGAVGAVGGCRVVTRAATAETRHKGSTYTYPYNEVSGRMSAEQMRAALAGEAIPADPRDATPEPTPEEAEAEPAADPAQEYGQAVDAWEGEGGAAPGVDTPRAPEAGPTATAPESSNMSGARQIPGDPSAAAADPDAGPDPEALIAPETTDNPQDAPAPAALGLASPGRVAEPADLAPEAALTLF